MGRPSGIGKLDRERITAILRNIQHTISVKVLIFYYTLFQKEPSLD